MSNPADSIFQSPTASPIRNAERRTYGDLIVPALNMKEQYQEQLALDARPGASTAASLVMPATLEAEKPETSPQINPQARSLKSYDALRTAGEERLKTRDYEGFNEVAEAAAVSSSLSTKEFNSLMSHWADLKKSLVS